MLIEKAKKCNVFGIIVVNSWVHKGGKQAVKAILDMLTRNDKKGYVFTMSNALVIQDKLNEPKIKNFSEIEAYVVLSCPGSSFYDYKDLYKVDSYYSRLC